MMKEAIIHLPKNDNDGESLEYSRRMIEVKLLQEFGGYTKAKANGAWLSPTGNIYDEEVFCYRIAAHWDAEVDCGGKTKADILRDIANKAAITMMQECIYVVLPSGVEFIDPVIEVAA